MDSSTQEPLNGDGHKQQQARKEMFELLVWGVVGVWAVAWIIYAARDPQWQRGARQRRREARLEQACAHTKNS